MGVYTRFRNGCQAFVRELSTSSLAGCDKTATTSSRTKSSRAQRSRRRKYPSDYFDIPTTSYRAASTEPASIREKNGTRSRFAFSWTNSLPAGKLNSAQLRSTRRERAAILDRYIKRVLSLSSSDQARGSTILTLEDIERGKAHTARTINYYNKVKGLQMYSAFSSATKYQLENALAHDKAYRARLLEMEKRCDADLGIDPDYDSWEISPTPTCDAPVISNTPSDTETLADDTSDALTLPDTSSQSSTAIPTIGLSDLSLASDTDLTTPIASPADLTISQDDPGHDSGYDSMSESGSSSNDKSVGTDLLRSQRQSDGSR